MQTLKDWAESAYRQRWLLIVATIAVGALLIGWASMAGTILLKIASVTLFGALGYYIDRAAFPYARPHELMARGSMPSFDAAQIRRAIIIGASMLAGALAI